jgi:hypothetical protein
MLGVRAICSKVQAAHDVELEVRGWRFEARELEQDLYFGSYLDWRA